MSDPEDCDYYAEPDPAAANVWRDMLTTAGVANGYVVLSDVYGGVDEVLTGTLISEGNGKFYWQPTERSE